MNDKNDAMNYHYLVALRTSHEMNAINSDFLRGFSERKMKRYISRISYSYTLTILQKYISRLQEQLDELNKFKEAVERFKRE